MAHLDAKSADESPTETSPSQLSFRPVTPEGAEKGDGDDDGDGDAKRLFSQGVQEMQSGTRKYAKRQVSWIRNKLLPEVHKARRRAKNQIRAGAGAQSAEPTAKREREREAGGEPLSDSLRKEGSSGYTVENVAIADDTQLYLLDATGMCRVRP